MKTGWGLAEAALRCGGCDGPIPAGGPVRWVFGRERCATCAKRRLDEDVPADIGVPETRERLRLPSSFARWQAPAAVDGRMKRAGGE